MALIPKQGTLERILLDAMVAAQNDGRGGVTYLDLAGTGITEENIDEIVNNLRSGMFEAENDHELKLDA